MRPDFFCIVDFELAVWGDAVGVCQNEKDVVEEENKYGETY